MSIPHTHHDETGAEQKQGGGFGHLCGDLYKLPTRVGSAILNNPTAETGGTGAHQIVNETGASGVPAGPSWSSSRSCIGMSRMTVPSL